MDQQFVSEEKSKDHVVLVVDRENYFGGSLVEKIHTEATVVLVSEEKVEGHHFIHVPFEKRIPEIPEGTYSHIFLFSENTLEHELLQPLAEKAKDDNAKLIYILPYWLYSQEIIERLSTLCKRWVLVLMGDTFGGNDTASHISRIFEQAKHQKKISLPDLGLETIRPVAFSDALDALLRIGFGLEKEHICLVFPKHPQTALSVVHALQKIDPLLKVDFVSTENTISNSILPEGTHLFSTDYPVFKKMQDAYENFEVSTKKLAQKKQTSSVIAKKKNQKLGWGTLVTSFLSGVFFLLLLPIFCTAITAGLGVGLLGVAKTDMDGGKLDLAQTAAQASSTFFTWAIQAGNVSQWELETIGWGSALRDINEQLITGEQLAQLINQGAEIGGDIRKVTTGKTITPEATFTNATLSIKNALVTLQNINTRLLPGNVQKQLSRINPITSFAAQIIDIAPILFGFDRPKTYLLVFQDNNELRPGGGVINSYATVPVSKGKIGKVLIHNVFDADNQLKGHVEPPFAIRRYLPSAHWYLRDSNFSADNVKNAQTEAFFLQQEEGIRVDGVFAVDASFVKDLLTITGGVYVSQYKQIVTTDNFAGLMQKRAIKNNAQPEGDDFFTALLNSLQVKLQTEEISPLQLLEGAILAVEQKHLLFAFSDSNIQQIFTVNNMSGALWDGRSTSGNTMNDFIGMSEANLGVNKENAYIKRSITQQVSIAPTGTISGELLINYQNTSDGSWPGGDYKTYVRVLLPSGAQLTNIALNSIAQSRFPAVIDPKIYEAKGFKQQKGLEIEHTQEGGREEYGFLVTVPAKSSLDVTVSYSNSQKIDLTQPTANYDMLFLKQPGTDTDRYTFTLTYPTTIKLASAPTTAKKTAQQVVITHDLATDVDYPFSFVRQ